MHGQDGMDELTTTTKSWAASLDNGKVSEIEIAPEDIGVKRASLADLKGGDPAHNAEAIHKVLAGEKNAFRDIVVLNSAAALDGGRQSPRPEGRRCPRRRCDRQWQSQGRPGDAEEDLRMSDTLTKIVADKRRHVEARKAQAHACRSGRRGTTGR